MQIFQKKRRTYQILPYFCAQNAMMENISSKILSWYRDNKRELPWRDTNDPYRIWVSEIILQQTRVAQGYDYFVRFMKRFPNVESLALADEDEVMKYWQGLGYYSRARNLHQAAKSIVTAGEFPNTYEGVRALKGVGDYTAAAICSFAYQMPYAAVDGNVYRIIARLWGIETPIDSTLGKKLFHQLANELLDKQAPGDFNQAMMDFGALQCIPQNPNCDQCPLNDICVAYQKGKIQDLPVKQHRAQTKNRYFNYIYVRAGTYTYLSKRGEKDIWRNLYELPLIETDKDLCEEEFYKLPQLSEMINFEEEPVFKCRLRRMKHVLSHRVIYATFYEVTLPENTRSFKHFLRIKENELERYAVPRLVSLFLEKK